MRPPPKWAMEQATNILEHAFDALDAIPTNQAIEDLAQTLSMTWRNGNRYATTTGKCETCKWFVPIEPPKGSPSTGNCLSLMEGGLLGGIKFNPSRPGITTGPGDKHPTFAIGFGCIHHESE